MKKRIAMLLALCLALAGCLTACGGSGESGSQAAGDTAAAADVKTGGETIDVGDFTVLCPEGWLGVVQTDPFGEKDADGNSPARTDAYMLVKGGESEWDAFTKPGVSITYWAENDAQTQGEGSLWFYDKTQEIEVTVGGVKCPAWEVESEGLTADSPSDFYQLVFIPVTETSCFQVNITKSIDGDEGITFEDAGAMAIMESLKVK